VAFHTFIILNGIGSGGNEAGADKRQVNTGHKASLYFHGVKASCGFSCYALLADSSFTEIPEITQAEMLVCRQSPSLSKNKEIASMPPDLK